MLGHADRRDGVEALAPQLAVVLQADLDPVADAGLGRPLAGEVRLGAADRDADDRHVVVLRGVDGHRAPSAADVEQASTGPLGKAELATDQLVLGGLRRGEVGVVVLEPGARVRHRRPEHDPIEVVADVVVVPDGGSVAAQRVPAAAQVSLLGRPPQGAPQDAQPAGGGQAGRQRRPAEAHALASHPAHRRQRLEQVAVGVQVAGDVGPGQPELVRAPQDPPQGVLGAHAQRAGRRRRRRSEVAAIPELDAQRQLGAEQRADERPDGFGDRARRA